MKRSGRVQLEPIRVATSVLSDTPRPFRDVAPLGSLIVCVFIPPGLSERAVGEGSVTPAVTHPRCLRGPSLDHLSTNALGRCLEQFLRAAAVCAAGLAPLDGLRTLFGCVDHVVDALSTGTIGVLKVVHAIIGVLTVIHSVNLAPGF